MRASPRAVHGGAGALVAALLAMGVSACGADADPAARCPPIASAAADTLAGAPKGLHLAKLGTVVDVAAEGEQTTVSLQADSTVTSRADAARSHFAERGWTVVGHDDEGFEAEVFLVRDEDTGVVRIREDDCDGRVTIEVTVVDG